MAMALTGIRVLDLSRYGPGLLVGMMLGDMGADVVKLDEPVPPPAPAGTVARGEAPARRAEREHPAYALNRNKRSLILNLKTEGGRTAFRRLAATADVVLEGFRPGVAGRLGIDYATLASENPRLVYCSLSGYGQDGPYRLASGHDLNYIAVAGALGVSGPAGSPPVQPGFQFADFGSGTMFAFSGILLALLARGQTGRGQYVDVAMTDGVVQLLTNVFTMYEIHGVKPERGRHRLSGAAPYYTVYECSDGKYLSIGAIEPIFWANLCRSLGHEQLLDAQHDEGRWPEMKAAFQATLRTRPRDEWVALLADRDICIAPVYELEEAQTDPQLEHRGMFVEVPVPGQPASGPTVRQIGSAIKLSDTPASIRTLAPKPGEHTDEILASLGYSTSDIAALRDAAAVG